jgi:hypothetical protein
MATHFYTPLPSHRRLLFDQIWMTVVAFLRQHTEPGGKTGLVLFGGFPAI